MIISNITDDSFQSYYLDFLNNFLTVQGFANFYVLSIDTANYLISKGREVHIKRTE